MSRHRNYLFTIFVDEDNWKKILCNISPTPDCKRITIQLEKTPTTDRLHFQGYIESTNNHSISQMRQLVKDWGANVSFSNKNDKALKGRAYCSKKESRVEGPWIWTKDDGWETHKPAFKPNILQSPLLGSPRETVYEKTFQILSKWNPMYATEIRDCKIPATWPNTYNLNDLTPYERVLLMKLDTISTICMANGVEARGFPDCVLPMVNNLLNWVKMHNEKVSTSVQRKGRGMSHISAP